MLSFKKNLKLIAAIIMLVAFLCFILFPIFYSVIYSGFSIFEETKANNSKLLPNAWQWKNYEIAFNNGYLEAFGFSFLLALFLVILRLIVCGGAGYVLAKKKLKYNKVIAFFFIFLAVIPENSLYLGLLTQVSDWNLNSGWLLFFGLAAPNIFSLFTILIFQDGFLNISDDQKKLMHIDHLSFFQKLAMIWWPGLKHAIIFTTIITTITAWNAYLWPMIILPTNQHTLSTYVFSLGNLEDGSISYSIKLAGVVLYTLPVIIFYTIFHQKIIKTFRRI